MKIGDKFLYIGSDHPSLYGHVVCVKRIHKDYCINPDNYTLITDNAVLEQAGEITKDDLIEVGPFIDAQKTSTSWITSDVSINDLIPWPLTLTVVCIEAIPRCVVIGPYTPAESEETFPLEEMEIPARVTEAVVICGGTVPEAVIPFVEGQKMEIISQVRLNYPDVLIAEEDDMNNRPLDFKGYEAFTVQVLWPH